MNSLLLRNYDRPTDRPTERMTDRWGHRREVTLPIITSQYLGSSLPSNPGDADFRDLGLNLGGLLVDKGDGPLLPSPGAGRVVCRRETKQDANISKFIYSFFFFF